MRTVKFELMVETASKCGGFFFFFFSNQYVMYGKSVTLQSCYLLLYNENYFLNRSFLLSNF